MKRKIVAANNLGVKIPWFVESLNGFLTGVGFVEVASDKYITRYLASHEYIFVEGTDHHNFNAMYLFIWNKEDEQSCIETFINGDLYDVEEKIIDIMNKDNDSSGYDNMNWKQFLSTLEDWW